MDKVTKLIIDPIHVDELTYNDIHVYHITDAASAIINLPNGIKLNVPKSGETFDLSGLNIKNGSAIDAKLYMYDRQPSDDDSYFIVHGNLQAINGVAHMHFRQNGPAIYFHLCNSS